MDAEKVDSGELCCCSVGIAQELGAIETGYVAAAAAGCWRAGTGRSPDRTTGVVAVLEMLARMVPAGWEHWREAMVTVWNP